MNVAKPGGLIFRFDGATWLSALADVIETVCVQGHQNPTKNDADLESCTDTAKSATGDAIQWSGHNLDQYSAAHGCFVDCRHPLSNCVKLRGEFYIV